MYGSQGSQTGKGQNTSTQEQAHNARAAPKRIVIVKTKATLKNQQARYTRTERRKSVVVDLRLQLTKNLYVSCLGRT
jgi:hypothetical protein